MLSCWNLIHEISAKKIVAVTEHLHREARKASRCKLSILIRVVTVCSKLETRTRVKACFPFDTYLSLGSRWRPCAAREDEASVRAYKAISGNSAASTTFPTQYDVSILDAAGIPESECAGVLALTALVGCLPGQVEPLCDPLTLLRFLRSRAWVVVDAHEMYTSTVTWRKNCRGEGDSGLSDVMAEHGYGVVYMDGCLRAGQLLMGGSAAEAAAAAGMPIGGSFAANSSGVNREVCLLSNNIAGAFPWRRSPSSPRAFLGATCSFVHMLEENSEEGAPVAVPFLP